MFAFNRSAIAVLAPLALLVGVVVWSNLSTPGGAAYAASQQAETRDADRNLAPADSADQTVAANLPSR